jgi:hypothetical protein
VTPRDAGGRNVFSRRWRGVPQRPTEVASDHAGNRNRFCEEAARRLGIPSVHRADTMTLKGVQTWMWLVICWLAWDGRSVR